MPHTKNDFIKDLPKGPLDEYRRNSRFNWKDLKLVFEDAEQLKLKQHVWNTLEKDPIFRKPETETETEETKRRTAIQFHQYCKYNFLPENLENALYKRKTRYLMTVNEALAVCYPDISVKYALGISLFTNAIITLGTERHSEIFKAVWNRQTLSCVALTEVAHGSNTKSMRTTATFDKETQEFVINTPDFEAAKCWVGNLGKTCTLSLLFAQLYTNGQCHGLHAFVVPIRDPKTLLPYPGIIVGDIGEKIGLNGIDNGFMMFQHYRIPREYLLNRTGDVTPSGEYESSFSEPGRILGAALENLSTGRVGIMQESVNNLICAVTISVRYSAVRKQFAPYVGDTEKELSIIEYQLHQWRLFPYVSAAAVLKVFVNAFTEDFLSAVESTSTVTSTRIDSMSELVSEVHAIVSAAKPLVTWSCRDAVQESREACGGHGYLRRARFGELRATIDPCVTYEGDNNVLVQQTSNWLLRQWHGAKNGEGVASALGSCSYLVRHKEILQRRFTEKGIAEITTRNFIIKCFEWLITYLVSETDKQQKLLLDQGECRFTARNNSQVYKAAVLSRSYCEFLALQYYWRHISSTETSLRAILENLGIFYGLSALEKHLVYFYQGSFANGPSFVELIKGAILKLCNVIKPDVISVIDGLAPPDYVVNSILGKADGKVYHHLQTEFFSNPGALSRPSWWHEILIPNAPEFKSKL